MGDGSNAAAVQRFAEAFGDEIATAYMDRMRRMSGRRLSPSDVSVHVRYYDHTGMGHVFVRIYGVVFVDPDPVFDPSADTALNARLLSGFVGGALTRSSATTSPDGLTALERRLSDVMEE